MNYYIFLLGLFVKVSAVFSICSQYFAISVHFITFSNSYFLILGMELPWYAKPAVILGKFYPEITIKKVYKEDKLPPYLPKGKDTQFVVY